MKIKRKTQRRIVAVAVVLALVLAVGIWAGLKLATTEEPEADVITVSTLTKIIQTSDLSTYRTNYNGVATALDEKSPDKVDYYVSYQATVEAGIDFRQTDIQVDSASKTVVITLPEVTITHTEVDPATLDYIFVDKKAETPTVSEQALKLCEADVAQETANLDGLLNPARENARNTILALTQPLISQGDPDFTLIIQ